ncbi:MAG: F0F1 ATP synthase subunit A [Lachnospiraceae bacterium]|nr:F0F1 ATP synthase subunit A [Lachnospiraceae bacterium]
MVDIAAELQEQLNIETVFTARIGNLEIPFSESTVATWIIIGIVLVVCLILGTNLRVRGISKRQAAAEFIVTKLESLVGDMVGEEGKAFVPYLLAVFIFLLFSNTFGIFGFKPPTKDLNVTAALAILSIIIVQIANIRANNPWGWIKSFAKPIAVVTPINILELVIKPLSLCMRLFGNVLGAFIIMELIKSVVPVALPAVFSLYFDLFDGILQAYVFVFLTSLYIKEAVE